MRALFLSDAHLCFPSDINYRVFCHFLEAQRGNTDLLVFLGDIFEFWIGKDSAPEEHSNLINLLEEMTNDGTRIVYVEGNHDFHLGPVFTDRLNCQVFPNGGGMDIDGHNVFLTHGDLANPNDKGYKTLRRFLRSGFIKFLIRNLPSRITQVLATKASYESRKSSSQKRHQWPAREILSTYALPLIESGYQVVISGHFHQPFQEDLGRGQIIALGDWITQFSYAVYDDGRFTLTHYTPEISVTAPED